MVTGQGTKWDMIWPVDTNSIWIGSASDPQMPLDRDDRVGSPNYQRIQNVPAAAVSLFPKNASELNGGDVASTWISTDHLVAQDFNGTYFNQATGSFHAAYGGLTDIDLKGPGVAGAGPLMGSGNLWAAWGFGVNGAGPDGSTASSGSPYFAGCIRQGEIRNGLIPHALAYFTDFTLWTAAPYPGQYVWPAMQRDDGTMQNQGNLYFGSLLALLPSFNVNALKTPEARTIAVALQRYGAYTINSSPGWGNQGGIYIDFRVDAEVPGYQGYAGASSGDDFNSDMSKIARALQVVTNSHRNGGPPVGGIKLDGGDGALLAPLAPPFNR